MALQDKLMRLLADPAPEYIFEISEGGIAYTRPGAGLQPMFEPLEPGVITVSPLADNILRPEALADKVRSITPGASARKRRRAALILPDFSARVAILGFDSFPTDPKEQLALVRFRMKKSVPFDVESAVIGYFAQSNKTKNVEIVVVAAALEIIARYEAPFRAAGLHPGFVTTSLLTMAELNKAAGTSVIARMNGRALTVAVVHHAALKLVRCVELMEGSQEEMTNVLFPTMAYVEDELGAPADKLLLCGFEQFQDWEREFGIPVESLQSRWGEPNQYNAGLLGYMEAMTSGAARVA